MNARCFHQLIVSWRALASGLPDRRTGQKRSHTMADIASSAMAVFFFILSSSANPPPTAT